MLAIWTAEELHYAPQVLRFGNEPSMLSLLERFNQVVPYLTSKELRAHLWVVRHDSGFQHQLDSKPEQVVDGERVGTVESVSDRIFNALNHRVIDRSSIKEARRSGVSFA
jgi:hypothetical protein